MRCAEASSCALTTVRPAATLASRTGTTKITPSPYSLIGCARTATGGFTAPRSVKLSLLAPVMPLTGNEVALWDTVRWETDAGPVTLDPGFRFDGASIPRWAWWPIGHPLTGEYVYAAALHDARCYDRTVRWEYAHWEFVQALRAEALRQHPRITYGMRIRFTLIRAALQLRGPRWTSS